MRVIPSIDGLCPSCRNTIAAEGLQPQLANPFADPQHGPAERIADTVRDDNPYASSPSIESEGVRRNPLLVPAWFLLVGSILWFPMVVWVAGLQILTKGVLTRLQDPGAVGELLAYVLFPLLPVVTIAGAISMINRQSFRSAWIGACVALIPACGPCYGFLIPFAIWAIVLLWRPEVKASFRN